MWLSLLSNSGFFFTDPFSCISSGGFISSIGSSFNSMSHFGGTFCVVFACRPLSTDVLNSGWEHRLLFTEANILLPCSDDEFWAFLTVEWCWPKWMDEAGLVNFRYKNTKWKNWWHLYGCRRHPFSSTNIVPMDDIAIWLCLRVGMQNVNVIIL